MKPLDAELSRTLNGLAADMRRAEDRVAAREAFDLGGLDDRIQGVCETLQSLPADAASPFLPQLERLYDAVDRLVHAIDDADATQDAAERTG